MKKLLIALTLLATVAGQGAAELPVVTTPVRASASNDFVPARFAKDGKSKLLFASINEDGSAGVEVIDDVLLPCANFAIPAAENAESRTTVQNRKFTMPNGSRSLERTDCPLDSALSYAQNRFYEGFYVSSQDDGSIIMAHGLQGNASRDFYFTYVPDGNGRGSLYSTHFDYYSQQGSWLDGWDVEYSWTSHRNPPFVALNILDYNNGASSMADIVATQTLFNDDDAYEYIVPVYEQEIRELKEENRIVKHYQSLAIKGFSVKTESGSTLQTIEFENGLRASHLYYNVISLLLVGDERYLSCLVKDPESGMPYTILYRIAKNSSGIRQMGAPHKTRVYPTVVKAGEYVTVDAGDSEAAFAAHSSNGQILYSGSIAEGEGATRIPVSAMARGVNIVTVSTPGNAAESTKVIVK